VACEEASDRGECGCGGLHHVMAAAAVHMHVKVGRREGRIGIVKVLARRERRPGSAGNAADSAILDHQYRLVDRSICGEKTRGGEDGGQGLAAPFLDAYLEGAADDCSQMYTRLASRMEG
jgi:hypothetical protein